MTPDEGEGRCGVKKPTKTDRQRIAALERDVKRLSIQCGVLAGLIHYLEGDLAGKADKGSIDSVTGDWI